MLYFISLIYFFEPNFQFPSNTIRTLLVQSIWALLTGPILFVLIKKIHKKVERLYFQLSTKNNRYNAG